MDRKCTYWLSFFHFLIKVSQQSLVNFLMNNSFGWENMLSKYFVAWTMTWVSNHISALTKHLKKIVYKLFRRPYFYQSSSKPERVVRNAGMFIWNWSVWWRDVFLRIFTLAFLLFLAPAEALTLRSQFSNHAGQSFTLT